MAVASANQNLASLLSFVIPRDLLAGFAKPKLEQAYATFFSKYDLLEAERKEQALSDDPNTRKKGEYFLTYFQITRAFLQAEKLIDNQFHQICYAEVLLIDKLLKIDDEAEKKNLKEQIERFKAQSQKNKAERIDLIKNYKIELEGLLKNFDEIGEREFIKLRIEDLNKDIPE